MKIIKLDNEELTALKPLYEKMICPKKCHVLEKRIWFIPAKLLENMSNIEYTCCINCYYTKKHLDLLNGKYKREDLVPVFAEKMECNCDETDEFDSVSIKLKDGLRFGIYCQDYHNPKQSQFLKINEYNNNEIFINTPIIKGNLSLVIYKNLKDATDIDNQKHVLLGKAYDETITAVDYDFIVKNRFLRAYIQNGEYCLTVNDISRLKTNKTNVVYKNGLIDYNLYGGKIFSLILEYFMSNDMETEGEKTKLLINLDYSGEKKDIYTKNSENNYNKKNLEI